MDAGGTRSLVTRIASPPLPPVAAPPDAHAVATRAASPSTRVLTVVLTVRFPRMPSQPLDGLAVCPSPPRPAHRRILPPDSALRKAARRTRGALSDARGAHRRRMAMTVA